MYSAGTIVRDFKAKEGLDMCTSRGTQPRDWPLRLDWLQQPNECHIPMPSGFRNILRK